MSNDFEGYRRIAFNCILSDDEIINALSSLFSIGKDRVRIDRNDSWWSEEQGNKDIVCSVLIIGGEFPTSIEFISFLPQTPYLFPNLESIGRLCELLECHALVSDATTYNPYIWILVRDSRDHRQVRIDPEQADKQDVFIVQEIIEDEEESEGD